ncbi:hypothetical protein NDU88_007443 [Pleurodeles waltl]|uniref:Uncharacterized protein n=1 Tax=Pleurodeles waltl TaxID=8319 RepID=A0AAV7U1I2_PLEWA|nr:hypothetical protein NDU88_007443 [Pleurodeles waltl]
MTALARDPAQDYTQSPPGNYNLPKGWWGGGSRQTDVPATVRTESGTESRFSLLADALSGRHSNIDAASLAGNPDIRVPETVKTDDGLRARRVE